METNKAELDFNQRLMNAFSLSSFNNSMNNIFTLMHLADAFIESNSGYTIFISICVPWELNPQPFVLLTQCSTTEPQEHMYYTLLCLYSIMHIEGEVTSALSSLYEMNVLSLELMLLHSEEHMYCVGSTDQCT